MSHTPENWAKEPCEGSRHGGFYLVDSDGSGIGHIYAKFGAGEHNARRIVACVNACAGKETKDLEDMAGKDIFTGNLFSKRVAMEKERDTYRELCGELLEELKTVNASAESDWGADKETRALITKAEAILGDK